MNNRELASLLLVLAVTLAAISIPGIRKAAVRLLRVLANWRFLVLYLALLLWIGLSIGLAYQTGVWTIDLSFATVAWLFAAAGWLARMRDAGKPGYIRSRVRSVVALGLFLSFFVNLYVFSLPVELALQVVIGVLAVLSGVAQTEPRLEPIGKVTGSILVLVTIGLLAFSVWQLVEGWRTVDPWDLTRQLLLPVWLVLWTAPYAHLAALLGGYESLLQRVKHHRLDRRLPFTTALGVLTTLGFSSRRVWGFSGPGLRDVAQAQSLRSVRMAVTDWEASVRREEAKKEAARYRLVQYAGVAGTDDEGRQFDRREFQESKRALRWIDACHEGWYSRQNRYRPDLLTSLLADLSDQGLPGDHDVQMRVRQDGQAWYAYRQTPSGYWFGVGRTERGGYLWYWDGDEAPKGFPARRRGWSSDEDETRPEWEPEAPV